MVVNLECDNLACVALLQRCKPQSLMMAQLLSPVFILLACYDVHLHTQHLPGVENVEADALSRGWTITSQHFDSIIRMTLPARLWKVLQQRGRFTPVALLDSVGFERPAPGFIPSASGSASTAKSWLEILRVHTRPTASTGSRSDTPSSSESTPRSREARLVRMSRAPSASSSKAMVSATSSGQRN